VEHKGWDPVVVLVLHDDHECISVVGEGLAHQQALPISMSELEL
jgi:hypothetical protein